MYGLSAEDTSRFREAHIGRLIPVTPGIRRSLNRLPIHDYLDLCLLVVEAQVVGDFGGFR